MAKNFSAWLTHMMAGHRTHHDTVTTTINDVDTRYSNFAPFALGSSDTDKNTRRHRKEIYTKWELMLKDPSIAEAIGIHVTAALGGHESRSTMVFITPREQYRDAKNHAAKRIAKQLNESIKRIEPLINQNIVKLCRDGISFGDAYARIYGQKGRGVTHLVCNEYTYPPLIQAFEQAGDTIGYIALEHRGWQREISRLTKTQMLRLKIPRMSHIPQLEIVEPIAVEKLLQSDRISETPILPAHVGGSFLYDIEEPWWNVQLSLATMNSQQIADSVSQAFLTINMQGMPPAQQQLYKQGLEKIIENHTDYIRDALKGGEAIWGTQYHVLPTWDEKQVLNPIGDIKGQRQPINTEVFMINVRRLMGGLGLDPALVGWADMLSGGLGDGAFFHTSAQVMRRSILIRQAVTDFVNQLLNLDWGYCYGEFFDDGEYPWQVDFYSDQSAAATEAIQNKQNRMNTLALVAQSLTALKEVGLDESSNATLLEQVGGFDYEQAQAIARNMKGGDSMQEATLEEPQPQGEGEQAVEDDI